MAEAGNKQSKLIERDITGLKYFDQIAPLLQRLHDDACVEIGRQSDTALRPVLHVDAAVFLQPDRHITARTAAGQRTKKRSGRAGLCSCVARILVLLSESNTVFDAERLKDIIALIFAYRRAIEIFFRFFKHMLGCRHLLSHKPNGIRIAIWNMIAFSA